MSEVKDVDQIQDIDTETPLAARLAWLTLSHLLIESAAMTDKQRIKLAVSLGLNLPAVEETLKYGLWFPEKSRYYFLKGNRTLRFSKDDLMRVEDLLGAFFRPTKKAKELLVNRTDATGKLVKPELVFAKCRKDVRENVGNHLRLHRQFQNMALEVDMFATEGSVVINDKLQARATLTHTPFEVGGTPSEAVVIDWLEHFPEFPDLLDFVTAARFAPDRKNAYLFLQAASDFGKGLLFGKNGAFAKLGIVIECNEIELDAIIKGAPAGRTGNEFAYAWILAVNEPERVTKKTFALESAINVSAKLQLTQQAPLYAKIYTSADPVPGLTGENGVDAQLANRFGFMHPTAGAVNARPLFLQDQNAYAQSIVWAIAGGLNKRVAEYVALGEAEARRKAAAYLHQFHNKYSLGDSVGLITDHFDSLRDEFYAWAHAEIADDRGKLKYTSMNKGIIIQCPAQWWKEFVTAHTGCVSGHEYKMLINARNDIIGAVKSHTGMVNSKTVFAKGVDIPHLPESLAAQGLRLLRH